MAEHTLRQPTDVWVLTAVKTIRNGLGKDSIVSVDDATHRLYTPCRYPFYQGKRAVS